MMGPRLVRSLIEEFVSQVLDEKDKPVKGDDPQPSTKPMPGGWQPWPKTVVNIPYEPKQKGVGPGEDRLAKLLGGRVMGGGESYDIIDSQGNKWEVKEPSGGLKGEIRPGTEGLAAVQVAFGRIKNVVSRIESVFGTKTRSRTASAAEQVMGPDVVKKISDFVVDEAPMLMKGEVSRGRMAALGEVLHLINAALGDHDEHDVTKHVEMGDEETTVEKDVDLITYVKLGKVMDLDAKDLNVSAGDMLRSTFNGLAFRNPDRFIEVNWERAALASVVFGHTSGVILVSQSGYRMIPKSDIDNVLIFNRITKGFPHFKASG